MKTIIAEKPSVAREIALLLNANEKKDGYLEGNGYYVTWAFGHLVGLAMPEDYGINGFQKSALPILPHPFLLTPRKIRKNKGYEPDAGVLKQLKIIDRLFKQCSSIIVATDAGREGELIFRYLYTHLKSTKPFERLWISSLTEKAIRQGFANLKPGTDYDNLYYAAQVRSRADWLVGINSSQALTIAGGGDVYSLGRVQTPTLAMICNRFLENRDFKKQTYWQIGLEHRKEFIDFKSLSTEKWDDKKSAEIVLKAISGKNVATVSSVVKKEISEQPPLLFDLTGLQKEANKKLNFSAEETLNIAQSLYEKKFITYPRTGSKYIPEDLWPEIPNLVRVLDSIDLFKKPITSLKWGRFNKHIVNDLKVTDHHGLLVTDKIPSALTAREQAVYEMIAFRLLESVGEICKKEITDVVLGVLHYEFAVKGSMVLEPGWRAVKGNFSEDKNEPVQELPQLKTGDELKINRCEVLEKQTKPPSLFTEAGLLSAMETAGKETDSEEERKALQGLGIGTPATRASIIETLFTRNYIKREKKLLIPTEKGLNVFRLVKDKRISDVSMTAEWEIELQKIENGEADAGSFQKRMEEYASVITEELLSVPPISGNHPKLVCPKCQKQILIIREKLIICPDDGCKWLQYRNVCGVMLSVNDLQLLVEKRKTSLLKGMKSKAGKSFDAYLKLEPDATTSFEFPVTTQKRK